MIWIIIYMLVASAVWLIAYSNIVVEDDYYGPNPSSGKGILAATISFFIAVAWPITLIAVLVTFLVALLQNKWGNHA
jgi:hypothetical protein